jgi:hypothetical protein
MADKSEHDKSSNSGNGDNGGKPNVRFAVPGPFGLEEFTIEDMPEELKAALLDTFRENGLPASMPIEMREALGEAFGADFSDLPDRVEPANDADDSADAPHEPGCTCGTAVRDEVWSILDTAFPKEPHLWQAGEALLSLSAKVPQGLRDEYRHSALTAAITHLQHELDLISPSLSPVDQMIAEFRQSLDDASDAAS